MLLKTIKITMSTTIYDWSNRLKDVQESIENNLKYDCSKMSTMDNNTEKVRSIFGKNRNVTY